MDLAVAHVGLVPTMLEIAGGESPDRLRGHSLIPAMNNGQDGNHPGFAYIESHGGGNCTGAFGIRDGDWKYMNFTWNEEFLFKVSDDPMEKNNLLDSPEGRKTAQRLRDILLGEVDPEEVTRRAFDTQRRFLDDYAASKTEDELTEAFSSRMGKAYGRMIAAKCKAGSLG